MTACSGAEAKRFEGMREDARVRLQIADFAGDGQHFEEVDDAVMAQLFAEELAAQAAIGHGADAIAALPQPVQRLRRRPGRAAAPGRRRPGSRCARGLAPARR